MEPISRRSAIKRCLAILATCLVNPSFANLTTKKANFVAVYADPRARDQFFLFLQNVFRLYPEAKFHQLIIDLVGQGKLDDEAIYKKIQEKLPEIKTTLSQVTYSLPALKKQKEEMASQAASLLEGSKAFNGYLEIGTTGRYYGALKKRFEISGPVYVVNDLAPRYSIDDIVERGKIPKVGKFVEMGNYDDFSAKIPSGSLELVTNYIGFHHAPTDRFEGFVKACWNVLKPGGKLIVRDHDVVDGKMDSMVGLAHDVFNAGVGLTWAENEAQIRNFTSVAELQKRLAKAGFKREGDLKLQSNDPTKNTLMLFTKQTSWKS